MSTTNTTNTPFFKTKKGRIVINSAIGAVVLIGIALIYYFAITMVLLDLQHLSFIRYSYVISEDEAGIHEDIQGVEIMEIRVPEGQRPPRDFYIPSFIEGKPVTRIANYAFMDIEGIRSVRIPNSVHFIGDAAFRDCKDLQSINYSGNIRTLGTEVFDGTPFLTSLENNANKGFVFFSSVLMSFRGSLPPNTALLASDQSPAVSKFPDSFIDFGDFTDDIIFARGVFKNQTNLVYLEVPESARILSDSLFEGCTNLKVVDFSLVAANSNQEYSIGNNVFKGCSSLDLGAESGEFSLPGNITSIGTSAFENNATKGILKIGNARISASAFKSNKSINEVVIGNTFNRFENSIFQDCSSLNKITIDGTSATTLANSDSITYIGQYSFANTAFENFAFPKGVASIRHSVLADCRNLKTVTMYNESVLMFEEYSFRNTPMLEEFILLSPTGSIVPTEADVTFPVFAVSIVSIGGYLGESGLFGAFTVSGSTIIPTGNAPQFETVKLPGSIPAIGRNTFYGNSNLKSVTMGTAYTLEDEVQTPSNHRITGIGENAFRDCSSLTAVQIPETVRELGPNVFNGCFSLSSINYLPNFITITTGTFRNTGFTSLTLSANTQSVKTGSIENNTLLDWVLFKGIEVRDPETQAVTGMAGNIYSFELNAIRNNKESLKVFFEFSHDFIGNTWAVNDWHPELTQANAPSPTDFDTPQEYNEALSEFKTQYFASKGVYFRGSWSLVGGVPTPSI